MASGDPRVVMLSTKGFNVQSRCVGQNGDGDGPLSSMRGTARDSSERVSFPSIGCSNVGDRTSGSKGVYRNVERLYGLQSVS
jgi:hypothetical protein